MQPPVLVHPQQIHCRPSDRSKTNDFPVAICKVFRPIVEPWMKQARELFGFGVKTGKIRAFVEIAVMAGKRKVFRGVLSAVLSRDDVFDVKSERLEILMKPAILAGIFCALPDGLAQSGVHQPALARMRRALA